MTDARVSRMAQVLVDYSMRVKTGETVLVWGTGDPTKPLVDEVCREVIKRDACPVAVVDNPEVRQAFLEEASDDLLRRYRDPWVPLVEEAAVGARIETFEPLSLAGIDPGRVAQGQVAERALVGAFYRLGRAQEGAPPFVNTMFPTEAGARYAGMGMQEFEDYVFAAVDQDWEKMGAHQKHIIDSVLAGAGEIRIKAEDTDLTMSVRGRIFYGCHGAPNMPDGEIMTSPVEESLSGHIAFNFPAVFPPVGGTRVDGVQLWFEQGRVVKATAKEGQKHLDAVLDLDPGARYAGEFAFGTNDELRRWTGIILLDEKMGGTIHLAVGRSFPQVGGKNESSIHWDFIRDMTPGGEIWVDGTLIQKDGQWVF